ncbi:MAG: PilZ domain-containing protein [Sulfitobacter sp.]
MKYREQRYPTRFPIVLVVEGVRRQCTVHSISAAGASIVGADQLRIGQEVILDYSVGRMPAVVRWANQRKAGVSFDHDLSLNSLNRIRRGLQTSTHQHFHRTGFTELR